MIRLKKDSMCSNCVLSSTNYPKGCDGTNSKNVDYHCQIYSKYHCSDWMPKHSLRYHLEPEYPYVILKYEQFEFGDDIEIVPIIFNKHNLDSEL